MPEVHLSNRAQKFLNKLENKHNNRIREKLKTLSNEPVPPDAKFLTRDKGEKIFRIRIGHYRAIYKIKNPKNIILITKIDKRQHAYQH